MPKFILFSLAVVSSAAFAGPGVFQSQEEVLRMAEAGRTSILDMSARHFLSLEENGLSYMSGARAKYWCAEKTATKPPKCIRLSTPEQQQAYLTAVQKEFVRRTGHQPAKWFTPKDVTRTLCVDWVAWHLRAGYKAVGAEGPWSEVEATWQRNKAGHEIAKELQKQGWEAVFWAPDTLKPNLGATEIEPHAIRIRDTLKSKNYWGIRIDHFLTDYRPTAGSPLLQNPGRIQEGKQNLEKLKRIGFWMGIANSGYHVYIGYNGRLNESHSPKMPDNPANVEETEFSQWMGTESNTRYLHGVIMVPPGTWN